MELVENQEPESIPALKVKLYEALLERARIEAAHPDEGCPDELWDRIYDTREAILQAPTLTLDDWSIKKETLYDYLDREDVDRMESLVIEALLSDIHRLLLKQRHQDGPEKMVGARMKQPQTDILALAREYFELRKFDETRHEITDAATSDAITLAVANRMHAIEQAIYEARAETFKEVVAKTRVFLREMEGAMVLEQRHVLALGGLAEDISRAVAEREKQDKAYFERIGRAAQ